MEVIEEFPVYRSKDVPFSWRSVKEINADAVFHSDRRTRFQQGEIGNCWLAAAIESLRQESNQEAYNEVVQVNGSELEFSFWHPGPHRRSIKLDSDAVPTRDGALVFIHNVEDNEYWGILLEKAYAKWVGSYEGLEGGFWTDAIQSFTGGVVERIKLGKDSMPDNLFDIMLTSFQNGSDLCCIKKDPRDTEKYHSCCINIMKIEEDNRKIWVLDPQSQDCNVWTYEEFINEYHRLDMCHKNLDNLSGLQGRNIGSSPWVSQTFCLELENLCDEFTIELNDTDDDQEGCTFVVELVQKIKPDDEDKLNCIKPWDALVDLELKVGDEEFATKYPQETHCFTMQPGTSDIRVTTDTEEHGSIYMRISSKRKYEVKRKE
ncbi:calpain-2 catalytic subunit-like isoform X2 [Zootermopsis nevadensis]|uniref:calpain-2 catalytic subunit-like isoform X2 n=1 Tax=Zootermopsis nevadensis TaxID=136037 RepID=UPI000B8E874F|nr:calpain-2 catalytic subunit-like isoform X2 [Zootermopsis nevadensis]